MKSENVLITPKGDATLFKKYFEVISKRSFPVKFKTEYIEYRICSATNPDEMRIEAKLIDEKEARDSEGLYTEAYHKAPVIALFLKKGEVYDTYEIVGKYMLNVFSDEPYFEISAEEIPRLNESLAKIYESVKNIIKGKLEERENYIKQKKEEVISDLEKKLKGKSP